MTKLVNCIKYRQELPALSQPPFPGEHGKFIYDNVSRKAWQEWLGQQTMLVNEHRLNPLEKSTKDFLRAQMTLFFSGESEQPAGYVPEV